MANYHVGFSKQNGRIYAGTVTKKGDKWVNKSDVTDEALIAVRDHFLAIVDQQETKPDTLGYRWEFEDGSNIVLEIKINKEVIEN